MIKNSFKFLCCLLLALLIFVGSEKLGHLIFNPCDYPIFYSAVVFLFNIIAWVIVAIIWMVFFDNEEITSIDGHS